MQEARVNRVRVNHSPGLMSFDVEQSDTLAGVAFMLLNDAMSTAEFVNHDILYMENTRSSVQN
jgi:hypothetical protein